MRNGEKLQMRALRENVLFKTALENAFYYDTQNHNRCNELVVFVFMCLFFRETRMLFHLCRVRIRTEKLCSFKINGVQ